MQSKNSVLFLSTESGLSPTLLDILKKNGGIVFADIFVLNPKAIPGYLEKIAALIMTIIPPSTHFTVLSMKIF